MTSTPTACPRCGFKDGKLCTCTILNPRQPDTGEALRTQVIVKLTMLIGACRISTIKKKDIEQSLERFIKELEREKVHK